MRVGRRTVLASIGAGLAASLAGCGSSPGDSEVSVDAGTVRENLSPAPPDVTEPVPVQPAASAVAESVDRVEALLAQVPEAVAPGTIPNGVIREEIGRLRERAGEERAELRGIEDSYELLDSTRRARWAAGEAAVAFGAATSRVSLEAVRSRQDRVLRELRNVGPPAGYEGDRRARALYVASALERTRRRGLDAGGEGVRTVEFSPLDVGELGGRVEYASATRRVVEHLADRHRARLADPTAYRSAADRALDRSIDAADQRDLPRTDASPSDLVDADVERTGGERALEDALRGVHSSLESMRRAREAGEIGRGIRSAHVFETAVRTLERIRERVADGLETLERAETFATARQQAVEAARSAPFTATDAAIPAAMYVRSVRRLRFVDRQTREILTEEESPIRADLLREEYGEYLWARARFAALPDAVEAVDSRFDR